MLPRTTGLHDQSCLTVETRSLTDPQCSNIEILPELCNRANCDGCFACHLLRVLVQSNFIAHVLSSIVSVVELWCFAACFVAKKISTALIVHRERGQAITQGWTSASSIIPRGKKFSGEPSPSEASIPSYPVHGEIIAFTNAVHVLSAAGGALAACPCLAHSSTHQAKQW